MQTFRSSLAALALSSVAALCGCNAAPISSDEADATEAFGNEVASSDGDALAVAHRFGTTGSNASVLAFQRQNGSDSGYAIPAPYNQCVPGARAFKYLASDDWHGFNAGHRGAAHGNIDNPGEGFPRLRRVLADRGLTLSDVVIEFDPMALREQAFPLAAVNDSATHQETRHYTGANWRIRVRDPQNNDAKVVALNGVTNELALYVQYNDPANCSDDRISGQVSTRTTALYRSQSQTALLVGMAILLDLDGRPLVFSFNSMQRALRDFDFRHEDAVGAKFTTGYGHVQAL
jgi:hypothetical protein